MSKWLLIILMFFCCSLATASNSPQLQKAYQQAKKFHREEPIKAIELWQQYKHRISQLPAKAQYNWHQFTVIALLKNGDYSLAVQELGQLVYRAPAKSPSNIITLSNLAGVTFGYMGKPKLAQMAYQCALKQQPVTALLKARLLHNIALSQVNPEQINLAIDNFQQALAIVSEQNAYSKIALYSANLGYAYLFSRQPEKALPFFKRALFLEAQHGTETQKVKTALYLLNTVTQLERWNLYDRYFTNINNMINGTSDTWTQNYFTWVEILAKSLRNGVDPTNAEKASLKDTLKDVKNIRAIKNDYQIMADLLGIELPSDLPVKQRIANADDSKLIEYVKNCITPNVTKTAK